MNVTEKASKYIKRYYCKRCRTKDPKLEVVYKSKYKDDQEHIEREKRREEKKRRREERQKKEEAQAKKIKKLKIEGLKKYRRIRNLRSLVQSMKN